MNDTKHTPGPWFTKREGFSTVYIEARIGGGMLQEVAACGPTEAGQEQQEANARLIAAAPELLEALQEAKHMFAGEYPGHPTTERIFAAIAKATGETK